MTSTRPVTASSQHLTTTKAAVKKTEEEKDEGKAPEGYTLPIQELRELFSLVAKDLSYISTKELSKLMSTVGMPTSEEQLKEFISEVDLDGNGTIDFDEFVAVMTRKVNSAHSAEEVKHSFSVFRNPSLPKGRVRVSDIIYALTHYGTLKLSVEDATQLVSTLGLSPNDTFEFSDFVNAVVE